MVILAVIYVFVHFFADTEHSLNTLTHATIMHNGQKDDGSQVEGGNVKIQKIGSTAT